ncbi:MAG TPA: hypothetical protein PKV50_06400 [Prolixibacteraceae bacterium]|nr:hypothetical protein [Prolixibacteraceae bacterium]
MNKVLPILLLLLSIISCNKTESNASVWEIQSVTFDQPYFNNTMIIEFKGSEILVRSNETGNIFPAFVKDDRLVIETGLIKWLFEIERTSDSAMILHELYSKKPLEIMLIKIKNNHKS